MCITSQQSVTDKNISKEPPFLSVGDGKYNESPVSFIISPLSVQQLTSAWAQRLKKYTDINLKMLWRPIWTIIIPQFGENKRCLSCIFANFGRRSAVLRTEPLSGYTIAWDMACDNWLQAEVTHSTVPTSALLVLCACYYPLGSSQQCTRLGLHLQQTTAIWSQLCIREIECMGLIGEDWYRVWVAWLGESLAV